MTARASRASAAVLMTLLVAVPAVAGPPGSEVVTAIRVHGNHSIPDSDVVRLAGVQPGDEIGPTTLEAITSRLHATHRFDDVEVRKRYTSLTPSDATVLILLVRERPAPRRGGRMIQALRRVSQQTLAAPIVDHAEGRGFTYGARATLVDVLGDDGSLSIPVTFGGTRQAAITARKRFDTGLVHAMRGGVLVSQLENQHYRVDDQRVSVWLRADREVADTLRASTEVRWSAVRFGSVDQRVTAYRVGLTLDTRRHAGFARDAVQARVGWQWLDTGPQAAPISQPQIDARGFVGLSGQTVLALRARYHGASGAVPAYLQPLLGGVGSVRGHRVGASAGDRLVAASAELRVPVSSPIRLGRWGVKIFFDTGATYDVNERLQRARFSQGVGGGVFVSAAFLSLQLDVARDLGGGARVHVATGASF